MDCILCGLYERHSPHNSLRKNKVYTTAIITDETFMVKGRNYYVYKFKVSGKEYEGHLQKLNYITRRFCTNCI